MPQQHTFIPTLTSTTTNSHSLATTKMATATPSSPPQLLPPSPLCRFLEFLVVRYPVQVALGLFITVGGLLLAVFLAYQVRWTY